MSAAPPDDAPKRSRSLRRQARMDEACEAAMAIVREDGLHGLTIQKLAARQERSVGALYRYFRSKDALVTELQIRTISAYTDDRTAMLRDAEGQLGGAELLMAVAKHYQRWFLLRPGQFELLVMASAYPRQILPQEYGQQVMEWVLPALSPVQALLERMVDESVLHWSNPIIRTVSFWSCIQGVVQTVKIARFMPETLNNDGLLRTTMHTLVTGWGNTDPLLWDHLVRAEKWVVEWTREQKRRSQ